MENVSTSTTRRGPETGGLSFATRVLTDSVCVQRTREEIEPNDGRNRNSEIAVVPAQEIPRMIGGVSFGHGLIALWCLVALGCAQVTSEPRQDAHAEAAQAGTAPPVIEEATTPEPPFSAAVADISATTDSIDELPLATEPDRAPLTVPPEDIAQEASEPVVAPERSTIQEFEPAPSLVPSLVASPPETLDFSSLVARLRKTKAINLRAKVAVKNESDDLLEQFRAYHMQHGVVTLADLRSSYDSLFQKLHSLLEDADPPLARDIDRSRAAIWELLADPSKFSASHLMAGA